MTTSVDWTARAAALAFDGRSVVGGARVEPLSEPDLICRSPATGRVLHRLASGSAADADRAVAVARQAYEAGYWASLSPLIRKSILFGFAAAIDAEAEALALLDTQEMGKPIVQALQDAAGAAHIVRYYAEYADKAHGDSASTAASTLQYSRREPRGVVAAITPWNYPLPNAALKVGPALAAGNSVVLKPSELSPSSALRLAELAVACGIPPGVFNVVTGSGAGVGAALAAHPDVDLVAFTGSTATGIDIARRAASGGIRALQLECGGKSANLVFADVDDLDVVADDAARRIFDNQGQLCVAGARLIVHADIAEDLVERVIARAGQLRIGDPLQADTTFGPLASAGRAEAVLAACERAVKDGARLRLGGGRALTDTGGAFVQPTIFDQAPATARLLREDIFGPVLAVMTFRTPDEALRRANDTAYGLSATVWTRDLTVAGTMANGLRAGRVAIHARPAAPTAVSAPLAAEPFGQSGIGAEAGRGGYEVYTRLKAVEMHF